MTVEVNAKAPDFQLYDENGVLHKLSDYCGTRIVLYFYPADDTPGCTMQACEFRDGYEAYEAVGVKIIGVSPDNQESHRKFKAKYALPFTILADEDRKVCELYGVWPQKGPLGIKLPFISRTTFLIDADGKIVDIMENVNPNRHSAAVLAKLGK